MGEGQVVQDERKQKRTHCRAEGWTGAIASTLLHTTEPSGAILNPTKPGSACTHSNSITLGCGPSGIIF